MGLFQFQDTGSNLPTDETLHGLDVFFLLFGQIEIHYAPSFFIVPFNRHPRRYRSRQGIPVATDRASIMP
jgi:hypothetical protein